MKGTDYIHGANSALAFVSTNSISQGEQVGYLWPRVLEKVEIDFAHQSFKWTNNAKGNAGVTCIVVGLRNTNTHSKVVISGNTARIVKNISPYLSVGINTIAHRRRIPISKVPKMVMGNMARDGGNLILSNVEVEKLINDYPDSSRFIRKLFGAFEFLNAGIRWCLWITDEEQGSAENIDPIKERIKKTYEFRIASKAKTTQQYASIPHKFAQRSHI